MRTFVAIELNEPCREKLRKAIQTLSGAVEGVRWVSTQALHLTLKFIGEMGEADLPAAVSAVESAAARSESFVMEVSGLSGFPPRGKPRVVHVGAHQPEGALHELHRAVENSLAEELGVKRERRKFVPHITLGRVKKRNMVPTLDEMASGLKDENFGNVPVDSLVLMKSDLTPQGAIYTPLHESELGGG